MAGKNHRLNVGDKEQKPVEMPVAEPRLGAAGARAEEGVPDGAAAGGY